MYIYIYIRWPLDKAGRPKHAHCCFSHGELVLGAAEAVLLWFPCYIIELLPVRIGSLRQANR